MNIPLMWKIVGYLEKTAVGSSGCRSLQRKRFYLHPPFEYFFCSQLFFSAIYIPRSILETNNFESFSRMEYLLKALLETKVVKSSCNNKNSLIDINTSESSLMKRKPLKALLYTEYLQKFGRPLKALLWTIRLHKLLYGRRSLKVLLGTEIWFRRHLILILCTIRLHKLLYGRKPLKVLLWTKYSSVVICLLKVSHRKNTFKNFLIHKISLKFFLIIPSRDKGL